jgi:hypothetical protein
MCLKVGLHDKNCRVFWTMCFGQCNYVFGGIGQCVLDNVIMCLEVGLHGKNCRVFWTMKCAI